jgi:hypothetical protein
MVRIARDAGLRVCGGSMGRVKHRASGSDPAAAVIDEPRLACARGESRDRRRKGSGCVVVGCSERRLFLAQARSRASTYGGADRKAAAR